MTEPKKPDKRTTTNLDTDTLILVTIVQQSAIIKLLSEIKVILQRAKK